MSCSNLYQNGLIKKTWTHRISALTQLIDFRKLVKCELDFRLQVGNATKSLTEFVADGICNNFPYWFCCIFKVQQNRLLILLHFQNATKSVRDFVARCLDQCSIMPKGKKRKIFKNFQIHIVKSSFFEVKTYEKLTFFIIFLDWHVIMLNHAEG